MGIFCPFIQFWFRAGSKTELELQFSISTKSIKFESITFDSIKFESVTFAFRGINSAVTVWRGKLGTFFSFYWFVMFVCKGKCLDCGCHGRLVPEISKPGNHNYIREPLELLFYFLFYSKAFMLQVRNIDKTKRTHNNNKVI